MVVLRGFYRGNCWRRDGGGHRRGMILSAGRGRDELVAKGCCVARRRLVQQKNSSSKEREGDTVEGMRFHVVVYSCKHLAFAVCRETHQSKQALNSAHVWCQRRERERLSAVDCVPSSLLCLSFVCCCSCRSLFGSCLALGVFLCRRF